MLAQVTTGFTSAGPLVIPGQACKTLVLQNNGTGSWRISFDGGTGGSRNGSDPTTSKGYLLAPGMQLPMTLAQYPTFGPKVIVGIFVGDGTQLLDIITDDKDSTAPAHA